MSEAEVELSGAVNISKVESLFHQMEELFRDGRPVTIRAAEVTKMDTSTLQLMGSFIASMDAGGFSVSWEGVSDELVSSAKLLGLDQALNL